MAGRYPIPRPAGDDPRFTYGFIRDVAEVLAHHGFPAMTGDAYDGQGSDLVDLQQALFGLIYAPSDTKEELS